MPLDAAIGRGCGGTITQANQLCGLELDRFKAALSDGARLLRVAPAQEAAVSRESRRFAAGQAHLRQHPRDRRLVERTTAAAGQKPRR